MSSSDKLDSINSLSELKIVDIGGGEGNVITWLCESLEIPSSNIYCVENESAWSESYQFDNNIKYVFWDNKNIEIDDTSIDVTLIIVSMHHMDNQTIQNLMLNLKRMLKQDALII